jgi:hypothetical protein
MFLIVGLLALLGLAGSQATVLEVLLAPQRLVVLLFLSINLGAFWLALNERLGTEKSEASEHPNEHSNEPSPFSTAEIWQAMAAIFAVLVAAKIWGIPSTISGEHDFFSGAMQLQGILVPWVADLFLPCLLLATLLALPWLHRPVDSDPRVEGVPRNAGLILGALVWLLLVLLPMTTAAFQDLPGLHGGASEAAAPPVRTLAQMFWYHGLSMEMPSRWLLRESPGIALLLLYFALLPFVLPRVRASRGFCRRCHKALGARLYTVLLALFLVFLLVPLKMMSLWCFSIGQWITIPELPFHF